MLKIVIHKKNDKQLNICYNFLNANKIDNRYVNIKQKCLNTTKFDSIITRVAILTVQLLVPHSNIGAVETIAQLNMTNTALETVDVVEQSQRFNDHSCSSTCGKNGILVFHRCEKTTTTKLANQSHKLQKNGVKCEQYL